MGLSPERLYSNNLMQKSRISKSESEILSCFRVQFVVNYLYKKSSHWELLANYKLILVLFFCEGRQQLTTNLAKANTHLLILAIATHYNTVAIVNKLTLSAIG